MAQPTISVCQRFHLGIDCPMAIDYPMGVEVAEDNQNVSTQLREIQKTRYFATDELTLPDQPCYREFPQP